MKKLFLIAAIASLGGLSAAGVLQEGTKLDKIQQALKDDVPHILCVDERVATGGQPTDAAFAKLAVNGYRAVLSLRTASEGIDLKHEQEAVEKAGLHYVNIPVVSSAPKPEQVDEFIKAVKDKNNQPMLIHCGSANRVGVFRSLRPLRVQLSLDQLKRGVFIDKAGPDGAVEGCARPLERLIRRSGASLSLALTGGSR